MESLLSNEGVRASQGVVVALICFATLRLAVKHGLLSRITNVRLPGIHIGFEPLRDEPGVIKGEKPNATALPPPEQPDR